MKQLLRLIDAKTWNPERVKENKIKYAVYKFLHLFIHALKGFNTDHCFLHTATLTYYSILSIVPIIAMGFAIAKGFGLDSYLLDIVNKPNLQNKEIWLKIMEFANTWLGRTKGGLVAGVSIFVLLYSILSMIQNIEYAFNDIWKIKKPRTLIKKLTDYTTIVLLFPLLLIVSFSVSIFIQSKISNALNGHNILVKDFGILSTYLLELLPFILISIVFTFLYAIITNKKIPFRSVLYGGTFAGILFQLFQNFYIYYQIKLTSYNAVYGSFAAIPFFFIWMYYSWTIILLGAELAAYHENYTKYKIAAHHIELSFFEKKLYSVIIMYEIIKTFKRLGNTGSSMESLTAAIEIPQKNIKEIIHYLRLANLVHEIRIDDKNIHFQPACDISHYTIENIAQILEHVAGNHYEEKTHYVFSIKEHQLISEKIEAINNLAKDNADNLNMAQL